MLPDSPHDQARFFYLAILGVAVLVWVFRSYRHRLGQAAQHAAIWVLIFVGAVLAFGFQDNLRSMLFQGEPQMVSEDTIVLRRGSDSHFHTVMQINGIDVPFLVDTGATNLVLAEADARAAGIDLSNLSYVLRTQTANGEVMSAPVRLQTVRLGDFTDRNVRATVNGGDLNQSLLGMSYLNLYRSFRVEDDLMYLTR